MLTCQALPHGRALLTYFSISNLEKRFGWETRIRT
jgi:hypothetical protein